MHFLLALLLAQSVTGASSVSGAPNAAAYPNTGQVLHGVWSMPTFSTCAVKNLLEGADNTENGALASVLVPQPFGYASGNGTTIPSCTYQTGTANTVIGLSSGSLLSAGPIDLGFKYTAIFSTPDGLAANKRYFVGFSRSNPTVAGAMTWPPAAGPSPSTATHMAFMADAAASTPNWWFCTGDGSIAPGTSTMSCVDTGIAVSTQTMLVNIDAGAATSVTWTIANQSTAASGIKSDHLPVQVGVPGSNNQSMMAIVLAYTTTTQTINFRVARHFWTSN